MTPLERHLVDPRGEINGLKSRMGDLQRLLMVLIGIAGGGLVTAIVSMILQLTQ